MQALQRRSQRKAASIIYIMSITQCTAAEFPLPVLTRSQTSSEVCVLFAELKTKCKQSALLHIFGCRRLLTGFGVPLFAGELMAKRNFFFTTKKKSTTALMESAEQRSARCSLYRQHRNSLRTPASWAIVWKPSSASFLFLNSFLAMAFKANQPPLHRGPCARPIMNNLFEL